MPKQTCHQVPVKVEKQVPKTKCKKVPDKKCSDVPKFIPRKECKDFPKKVCTKDPIQVPKNLQIKVCSAHPKEVCIKIPKEVVIQVPKQVTKKVCTSTKGGGGYDDHHSGGGGGHGHSGYGRENIPAEEDESSIETYDFDGVAEVEFSELHSAEVKETSENLENILTPEWFADNNDWEKRLSEQEQRDGRSTEDLWGIDTLLATERDIGKNLTVGNTTDFILDMIKDIASDQQLGVRDLIDLTSNAQSNGTMPDRETPSSDSQNYSRFHINNRDNSRSEENPEEEETPDEKENEKPSDEVDFQFPTFGGFSPFGNADPFPSWK